MENFWNQKHLRPPAVYTIKSQDLTSIGELKSICTELICTLQKNEALHTEAALLSRMIYKNRNKFRFDKGFQNMRKVHRCLRRYLQLDFCSALQNFVECLPTSFKDMYLPSRQMLEYILVRLMGLASLLHQTCTFSETGAYCLHQERIHLAHSWSIPAVFLAIAARIWSLCEQWQKSAIWAYQKLLEFLPKLPSSKSLWLPEDCLLPPDLFSWLGKEKRVKKQDMRIFEIFVDDDDEMCDEIELVDPQVEIDDVDTKNSIENINSNTVDNVPKSKPVSETKPVVDKVPTLHYKAVKEDLGEALTRGQYSSPPAGRKLWSTTQQQKINALTNLDDLQIFVLKNFRQGDPVHVSKKKQLKKIIKKIKSASKGSNIGVNSLMSMAKGILLKEEKL